MKALPRKAQVLVTGAFLLGSLLAAWALGTATWSWGRALALVIAISVDVFKIPLRNYHRNNGVAITLDIVAVFVMLGLYGPQWAIFTALCTALVFGLTQRLPLHKLAFNAGMVVIATWVASLVLVQVPGPWPLTVVLGALLYYAINTGGVALVISLVSGASPLRVWLENSAWVALQHSSLAIAGYALGRLALATHGMVLLVALPIPMLHYTFTLYARATKRHEAEQAELSMELIETLASIVDARDAYTFGHSTQVARYSVAIARRLGYSEEALARLYQSALLHDIGKIGIPEEVLFKPGKLSHDEFELMKRHTTIGYEIIKHIKQLRDAARVALNHHERWNGSGYPAGLKGEAVEMDSRIVGLADSLDTILSDRPYRKGATLAEAIAELERCSGVLYDPKVVRAFHQMVSECGADFFVNSASLVEVGLNRELRWKPVDHVAFGARA